MTPSAQKPSEMSPAEHREQLLQIIKDAQESVRWWPDDVRRSHGLPELGADHPVAQLKEQVASLERRLAGAFEEAAKVCDDKVRRNRESHSQGFGRTDGFWEKQATLEETAKSIRSLIGKQP